MEWIFNAIGSLFSMFSGGGGQGNWLTGILKMFGFGGDNAQQPAAPAESGGGNFFSQMMKMTTGGAAQAATAPPVATNVSNMGAGNVTASVQDITVAAKTLTNNKSQAYFCSVDAQGRPIAGNAINVVGDTASTTKAMATHLVAEDPTLQKGFCQRPEIQKLLKAMSSTSSNDAADALLQAVAKESKRPVEQVISDYNKRLDSMGYKHLEIANFSGIPSAGEGFLFVKGFCNVGTAYEMAVLTQQFGSQHPDIAKIFAPANNHTGMGDVKALCVKTGTANGVIDRDNGANKSAIAFNGGGSIAVLESRKGEWMPTIDKALASLKNVSSFTVATGASVVAQGGKQANGQVATRQM